MFQYNSIRKLEKSNFSHREEEYQRMLADQIERGKENRGKWLKNEIFNQQIKVDAARRKYEDWQRTASSHRKEGIKPDNKSHAAFANCEKFKKEWQMELSKLNRLNEEYGHINNDYICNAKVSLCS